VDDEHLTQLGNKLRRFANGGTRSPSFIKEIEDYLLANFSDTDLFDELKEPLASYSLAGGLYVYDDSKLENVFRVALERISALCAGMGKTYLKLIDRYLAGEASFADFPSLYWSIRRGFYDRGMWFEGKLGQEVDTFDTDVHGIGDTYFRSVSKPFCSAVVSSPASFAGYSLRDANATGGRSTRLCGRRKDQLWSIRGTGPSGSFHSLPADGVDCEAGR